MSEYIDETCDSCVALYEEYTALRDECDILESENTKLREQVKVMIDNEKWRMGMDDINEIKREIRNLNIRLAKLETQPEKKEEGFKLWEPAPCNIFYVINAQNDVIEKTRSLGDYQLLATYNYYETEKLAEQEAKWLRAARKLRALARELNGDWKPDWTNDTFGKYLILKEHSGFLVGAHWVLGCAGATYFHSEQAAQTALDSLTTEEREVLFGY